APTRKTAANPSIKWNGRWLGVALIVVILCIWQYVSANGIVSELSFPRVSAIFTTWYRITVSGELLGELAPSLWRMGVGYIIGVAFGMLMGLLMGYFSLAYNVLEPLTEFLRPIPSPAYLPIVILFLGIDDEMKIFMIGFAAFFPVLLNTYSGVRSIDPIQIQT